MPAKKTEETQVPDKRDDSTDEPVTELAHVDGDTSDADMREMSGVGDDVDNASTQQRDAYEGMQIAAGKKDAPEVNPHTAGPGSDIG